MNRKRSKLHIVILSSWFICLIGLFAAFAFDNPNAASVQSILQQNNLIVAGSKLFNPTCSNAYCHGNGGFGGSAPTLRGKSYTMEQVMRVITEGVSGTPMPAFKNNYSKKEIEQLAAYVMWIAKTPPNKPLPPLPKVLKGKVESAITEPAPAPVKGEPNKGAVEPTADATEVRGDAAAGQFLFFDAANHQSCRACHLFQGRGGKLGPDLTNINSKSARDLYLSITEPHTTITANYELITLTTRDGERLTGIKREEVEDAIKIFDTKTMPPVLRTLLKSNVAKSEPTTGSAMPGDYATRYTKKQLLDLIAFLKSTSQTPTSVTLKDIQ
jgi:putative heme-binding domain-containing protein